MILDCEIEKLAKELHKFYRAAHRVLNGPCIAPSHEHGWRACHKQKYFLKRARSIASAMNNRDFKKLLPHMQSSLPHTCDQIRELQRRASGHCTCDGGNTNCAACVAERTLRNIGRK